MPIRRDRYAHDWPAISHRIRFERAGGKCEGSPAYPDCRAEHGKPHPVTGRTVFLQTAHWPEASPANNEEGNLHAWCAKCHNSMDGKLRVQIRRRQHLLRQQNAGQRALIGPRLSDLSAEDMRELESAWLGHEYMLTLPDGVDHFEAFGVTGAQP